MLIALAILAGALGVALGYAWGRRVPVGSDIVAGEAPPSPSVSPVPLAASAVSSSLLAEAPVANPLAGELARIVRSYEGEAARLRSDARAASARVGHLQELAEERWQLFGALATAHAEKARFRQLVIDIENNAPPPLLGGPGTPDDLKLIVGIGPVLERMLHQLGITTYRQIARWSERDIDDIDARLTEFPGRIRRDAWVTQARALHQGLHGELP